MPTPCTGLGSTSARLIASNRVRDSVRFARLTLTPIRKCYFPAKLRARLIIPDEKSSNCGDEMYGLRLRFGRIALWIAIVLLLIAPAARGQSGATGSVPLA